MPDRLFGKKSAVDRDAFIQQFVASFLATWCANNYDDCCARGEHDRLNHPPVEDAVGMAETAWDEMEKVLC